MRRRRAVGCAGSGGRFRTGGPRMVPGSPLLRACSGLAARDHIRASHELGLALGAWAAALVLAQVALRAYPRPRRLVFEVLAVAAFPGVWVSAGIGDCGTSRVALAEAKLGLLVGSAIVRGARWAVQTRRRSVEASSSRSAHTPPLAWVVFAPILIAAVLGDFLWATRWAPAPPGCFGFECAPAFRELTYLLDRLPWLLPLVVLLHPTAWQGTRRTRGDPDRRSGGSP